MFNWDTLKNDEVIEVEDYSLYGHNRQDLHSRAKAGSGGFGFLVNNHILKKYTISHINKGHDGILSIKLLLNF